MIRFPVRHGDGSEKPSEASKGKAENAEAHRRRAFEAPRRVGLSESEMERIMLGGADP